MAVRGTRILRHVSLVVQIAVIVFVLLLAAAIWIAIHAVDAGGRLDAVHDDIARVRADIIAGQSTTKDLEQTQQDARAAEHDTHDPVWGLASWLPPIKTIRGLSSAADDLATHALPPLAHVGSTLQPSRLRIAHNQIALAPLTQAVPDLTKADAALVQARDTVAGLPGGWIGLIGTVRDKVLTQLTSLSGSIDDATRFARVGPDMLGANGKRRYFVGIENNAESRATGGLVAAYAILTADHGRIRVTQRGNDAALHDATGPTVSLGADYDHVYGNYDPTQSWITSNLSPDFPDAADIWAHLWERQSGEHIDGAFGVDPFALQSMLAATGPVTVAGYPGMFTGTNLAHYIEARQYVDFQGAEASLRKDFVAKVSSAVLDHLLSGAGDPSTITSALGASAGAGHLTLWSARPSEEAQIAGTPLAGELVTTTSPYAAVHVDSATGTKLDYYLNRTLTYTGGACHGATRNTSIRVTLTNNAPLHGLPAYVRLRGDIDHGTRLEVENVPRQRLFVYIHATAGAALEDATLDGAPAQVSAGVEQGHPVFGLELSLDPGVARTIQIRLQEPTAAGRAMTQVQPMARAQRTTLSVPACS